jgi:hypothetical protein
MYTSQVTYKIVLPSERSSTRLEGTYEILLLEVYVLFVSTQVCSEAETQRTPVPWTVESLSVHGIEVFAARVSMCMGDPWGSGTCLWALLLMQILAQPPARHVTMSTGASNLGHVSLETCLINPSHLQRRIPRCGEVQWGRSIKCAQRRGTCRLTDRFRRGKRSVAIGY